MSGQAPGSVTDAPDHRTELALEHTQGEIDLANAIASAGIQLLAQRVIGDGQGFGTQTLKRLEHGKNHQRTQSTGQQHLQHALPGQYRQQPARERRGQHHPKCHPCPQLPAKPQHR
ncbi:hypothetical protein D3C79_915370 [compost metagenome]